MNAEVSSITPSQTSSDVQSMNFIFLMALRTVATHNSREALVRFGIDDDLLELFSNASIDELQAFSNSPLVVFKPRFAKRNIKSFFENRMTVDHGTSFLSVIN